MLINKPVICEKRFMIVWKIVKITKAFPIESFAAYNDNSWLTNTHTYVIQAYHTSWLILYFQLAHLVQPEASQSTVAVAHQKCCMLWAPTSSVTPGVMMIVQAILQCQCIPYMSTDSWWLHDIWLNTRAGFQLEKYVT